MIEYLVKAQEQTNPDLGNYLTYGLCATENGALVAEIVDISPEEAQVHALAHCLNTEQVSVIHFHDNVEDFIAGV